MAGPEPGRRKDGATALLLIPALLAGLGCASGGAGRRAPAPEPPVAVQEPVAPDDGGGEAGAPEAAPPAEEAAAEEPAESGPVAEEEDPLAPESPAFHKGTDVVVISEGKAPDKKSVSLYEAAQRARRERGEAARQDSSMVITNETLEEQPAGGRISFGRTEDSVAAAEAPSRAAVGEEVEEATGSAESASGEDAAAGSQEEGTVAAEPPLEERDPELYWRTRIRDARLRWREAVEKVEELQGLVEQLRYDFYATDDPWLRDSSIKPAWDRALVDLEEARQEVDFQQRTVAAIQAEGRRAGALPGWLREGLELEPDESRPRRPGELDEHEAIEPVEVEEPDSGGDGR